MPDLSIHPLVQKNLRGILDYNEKKGGDALADRCFSEAEHIIERIPQKPKALSPHRRAISKGQLQNLSSSFYL